MLEMDDDVFLESRLWPWLDDPADEVDYHEEFREPEEPGYFCDKCDCGLNEDEAELPACPNCGHPFTDGDETEEDKNEAKST